MSLSAVFKPNGEDARVVATADLNTAAHIGLACKLDGTGKLVLCGAGDQVYGWLYEGAVIGRAATVHTGGIVKAKAGGTITPGARVTTGASGLMVAATSGDDSVGVARVEANVASGQWFSLFVDRDSR